MPCARCRNSSTCRRVLCNSQTLKTRQIRHCFIRRRPRLAGCYAIEIDHRLEGALQPDCVLDYRRESRVGGNNLVLPFDVAQHEMRQHRGPYLPFDRILVLAEERLELERLLEFLEEEFHRPPCLVQPRDRGRAPLEVVRVEHHLAHLSLDLDKGLHAAQRLRVVPPASSCQSAVSPRRR